MRRRLATGAIIAMIGGVIPSATVLPAGADQRCTPIAHVLDARQIPENGSQHPDSDNPDDQYKDQLELNCIPTYELDFTGALSGNLPPEVYQAGKCDPEGPYDQTAIEVKADPELYDACTRLKFTMGPLLVRPGMNDSLIHVTTFEHPMYNGYTLRWKPGLQTATGKVPLVQDIHLHHGTWISGVNGPTSAAGPFFATGEEQTILQFPKGYGWSMSGMSSWLMLYMLHNALPTAELVYITYDIDFVRTADAERLGLKDTRSVWMDAGSGGTQRTFNDGQSGSASTASYSAINPIFNAQRGFGHDDVGAFWGMTGQENSGLEGPAPGDIHQNVGTLDKVCTFPRENCAAFDSKQAKSTQQGSPRTDIIGRPTSVGSSWVASCGPLEGQCGTIVVMGGHLHPGGLRDEVSIRRGNQIRPLLISDAVYWDHTDPTLGNGPANSWDLSMTGQISTPAGNGRAKEAWKIRVRPGDELILNGIYDTENGSSYDQMAIVMAWVNPGYDDEAIDVFEDDIVYDAGWATGPRLTARPPGLPAEIDNACTPGVVPSVDDPAYDEDLGDSAELVGKTRLCLRGNVTHGSMPSRQDHRDCMDAGNCTALTDRRVPLASNTITMQGFTYGQMDLPVAQVAGIPQVELGQQLTFLNADMAAYIWHTVTACPAPCTGPTSASYPFAASYDTPVDFDSTIIGVGLGAATAGVTRWTYTPPQEGIYTFWCRIHPFMRGAFDVVAAEE